MRREDTEDGLEPRVVLHSNSPVVAFCVLIEPKKKTKKHPPKVELRESPSRLSSGDAFLPHRGRTCKYLCSVSFTAAIIKFHVSC